MKTRRLVSKVRKTFRHGEKGFTLIELLIVVAILGILAAVVLPNIGGFLNTGNLAAANSEVAAVKTAAAADYAADGTFDSDSSTLFSEGYLDRAPVETYTFNTSNGTITGVSSNNKYNQAFTFSAATQQWTN